MNSEIVQTTFDYGALDESKRVRIQVRVESIKGRMKRTAEDIIAIGTDLNAVKDELGHGQFIDWLKSEFDMTEMSAVRFMQAASRFGKSNIMLDLTPTILYLISSPSTPSVVADQVIAGNIPADTEAIKEASRKQKEAEREALQARIEAQNAKNQSRIFQDHSQLAQAKVSELTQQIADLEETLRTVQTPEKVEVTPQTTLDKITNLEALVKKLKEHGESMLKENKTLTDDLRKLREANDNRRRQEQYELEIKTAWRKNAEALNKALSQFAISIPSPIAIQAFGADEWARYEGIGHTLKRFHEAFSNIKDARFGDQFVESDAVTMPVVIGG